MKRFTAKVLLIFLLLSIAATSFSNKVYSGSLTNTFLRLSSQKTSTATGGTVCAQTPTSDNGTETSVQIIFPTSFTVNTTASNWTVDTSNLPSGATAWLGIGTATAVSGQIVTFPSTNLSTSTFYCFNFSGTTTLTTPSSTGNYPGTIRTRNSSNSTIDTIDYGVSIVSNNELSVTATVAANPTDFSAVTTLSNTGTTFPQSTTLNYTITYGSSLTSSTGITVEAEWSLGTISGAGSPSVDILDYVVGSASNGYNSTPAVIDTVNRKITWTISSFPGETTGQTVTFQLKTNNSYTGSSLVSFDVSGRLLGPGTQTADSTVTKNYQYNYGINPTATPTSAPGPTNTPTPGPAATATPTPTPTISLKKPVISDIEIRTVSSTDAAIFVATDKLTTLKLSYGTEISELNQSLYAQTLATENLLHLTGLKPNTRYYFRVTATDSNGQSTTSDIYLLDTANTFEPPKVLSDSLILTSGDVVLTDPLRLRRGLSSIVIPLDTPYSFKFALTNFEQIKSVKAIVRNNRVLGVINTQVFASAEQVIISEIGPGQYIGKLQTDINPGKYRLVIQIQDYNGNITEETISFLYVVSPLRVIDSVTKTGIENTKVTFYYYNQRLKTYDLLSSSITPIKNPNFSDINGYVDSVLPDGQYRAEVNLLGYESKTIEFRIGSDANNYPEIVLKSLPFSMVTYAKYTSATAYDIFALLKNYIHTLRTSIRFFDLIAFIIVSFFVLLSAFSAARRFSVPILLLPHFAIYHLLLLVRKPNHALIIHGRVITSILEEIVPHAMVYISLPGGKVITHTTTNAYGEFYTKIHEATDIRITVGKKGFGNSSQIVNKTELDKRITIAITPTQKPSLLSFETFFWYISFLLGSLFEAILIITLLIELLFTLEFGILRVIPFMLVSLSNITLWAVNARASRSA